MPISVPSPKKLKFDVASSNPSNVLKFLKISSKAQAPTKGSPLAAGYDLYSATDVVSIPQRFKHYLLLWLFLNLLLSDAIFSLLLFIFILQQLNVFNFVMLTFFLRFFVCATLLKNVQFAFPRFSKLWKLIIVDFTTTCKFYHVMFRWWNGYRCLFISAHLKRFDSVWLRFRHIFHKLRYLFCWQGYP